MELPRQLEEPVSRHCLFGMHAAHAHRTHCTFDTPPRTTYFTHVSHLHKQLEEWQVHVVGFQEVRIEHREGGVQGDGSVAGVVTQAEIRKHHNRERSKNSNNNSNEDNNVGNNNDDNNGGDQLQYLRGLLGSRYPYYVYQRTTNSNWQGGKMEEGV